MIIGSHVHFKTKQILDSVKEAVQYNANTFMFYTGAPQNTFRSSIKKEYLEDAKKIMKENKDSLYTIDKAIDDVQSAFDQLEMVEEKYDYQKLPKDL